MGDVASLPLAVLAGDGIGPEITEAALTVLEAAARQAGFAIRPHRAVIGWRAYDHYRSTLPEDTLNILRAHEGWIVGPTFAGEYPPDDPLRGHPNGFLRRHFTLFANVRPVQAWPQLQPVRPELAVTVLRENTEGFYPDRNLAWGYGEFKPREDVALSLRVITGEACERFARFAFEYALAAGQPRLALVHKRTALPQTEGVFLGAFEALQAHYPQVAVDLVRIDTFSSTLPREPQRYPLVATTNLFGDILSDQAAGLAGGVGMAPSLNAGLEHAMAQAVHGTAPDIAGTGQANPAALILSTALLLRWFYQRHQQRVYQEAASRIEQAVQRAITQGTATPDLGGAASTQDFTSAVVAALA
jgi:3-isopropylmalate dehydrogenase